MFGVELGDAERSAGQQAIACWARSALESDAVFGAGAAAICHLFALAAQGAARSWYVFGPLPR